MCCVIVLIVELIPFGEKLLSVNIFEFYKSCNSYG